MKSTWLDDACPASQVRKKKEHVLQELVKKELDGARQGSCRKPSRREPG
jgi:hypothetical protein